MKIRRSGQAAFLTFLVLAALAAKEPVYLLEYKYLDKTSAYHHYIQGSIERKGEVERVHLQLVRNAQFTASGEKQYLLKEWGEKYQGSQVDFSELGIPGPGERVEKVMDRLGRVGSVLRYMPGHRYYLNWVVFPDHPLAAGASWKYEYPLVFDVFEKAVRTKCEINYTLEKVMAYKKFFAAKILVQGACRGQDGAAEMQYGFDGKLYFDIDQGREIDYQTNLSWAKADTEKHLKETARLEIYSILEK
jgi:hypothetical protein